MMGESEIRSCGCGSDACASDDSVEPIVCTLAGPEQAARADEFRAAFAHLTATEAFPGGFRWVFSFEPDLEGRLQDLARREHDCCRFFDFRVFREGDAIVWESRADERATAILDELMRLPDTLDSSRDTEALKRALGERAGLVFASDQEEHSG